MLTEILKNEEAVDLFYQVFGIDREPPSLGFLKTVLASFSRIPYENLSKIIKYNRHFEGTQKIRLPYEVMQDYRDHRLGGTCFSLTFLLQAILTNSGFPCYPVLADMSWGRNVHCCLVVLKEEEHWLVDPGYLLNDPMILDRQMRRLFRSAASGVQLTFDPSSLFYELSTFDNEKIKWRYRFQDISTPLDRFLGHWLDSFRWNTMHGFCLTRIETDRRVYVHKNHMRETSFSAKQNYNIKNRVHQAIEEAFGIDGWVVEEARRALDENLIRDRDLGLWIPREKSKA